MWGRLTSCDWVTPGGDYNQQFEVFTKLIYPDIGLILIVDCIIATLLIRKKNLLEMHSSFSLFQLDITLFQS